MVSFGFKLLEHCEKNSLDFFCSDCNDNFCYSCFDLQHSSIKKNKHDKRPFQIINPCKIHGKDLGFYCFYCEQLVCSVCLSNNEHNGHTTPNLESSMKELKEKWIKEHSIASVKENYSKKIKSFNEKIQELKETIENLEKEKKIFETKISDIQRLEETVDFEEFHNHLKNLKMVHQFEGKCIQTIEGHTDTIVSLIETKNGKIISGSEMIRVWIREGECIRKLKDHSGWVYALLETRDGYLISGSSDKTIKVWDGDYQLTNTWQGHSGLINCLIETRDGYIVSASDDTFIKIWNRYGSCVQTLKGHSFWVKCLLETKSGKIISGSADKSIKVWDKTEGTCLQTLRCGGCVLSLIEIDDDIVSLSEEKTIRFFNKSGDCIKSFQDKSLNYRMIQASNGHLITVGEDKTIKIWDIEGNLKNTIKGHQREVVCVLETKDKLLITGSFDKTIKIWK